MRCGECNREHATEPAFPRPCAVASLPRDERALRVKESNDLCRILPWMSERETRYFIRGVMFVPVDGVADATAWGLWAEVDGPTFETYVKNYRSPHQSSLHPLRGTLANRMPIYPETIGLPIKLTMISAGKRPAFSFAGSVEHPFAAEVRAGVTAKRLHEWLATADP